MRSAFLVVVLAAALASASCGREPGEPALVCSTHPDVGSGWLTVESGQREARRRSLPMLVLLTSPTRPCPPVARVTHLLSAGADLDAICVRVHVEKGAPGSPASAGFAARHGSGPSPTLYVVTADLEVLQRQTSGLYPFYDRSFGVLEQDAGPMLSRADLIAMVRKAVADKPLEDERLRRLEAQSSGSAHVERAEILLRRWRWTAARSAARAAIARPLGPDWHLRVSRVLLATDREIDGHEAARHLSDVLRDLSEAPPSGWMYLHLWRLEAAEKRRPDPALLEREIAAARTHEDPRLEACLRGLRVALESYVGRAPAAQPAPSGPAHLAEDLAALHASAVATFTETDPEGPVLFSMLSSAATQRGDFADAELWMSHLVRAYPESDEALVMRHGHLDRTRAARVSGRPERLTPRAPGNSGER